MFPDLLAFRNGTILLVECRVHGYIAPAERRKLVKLARKQVGGQPVLAYRGNGRLCLRAVSSKPARCRKPLDTAITDEALNIQLKRSW
jgi:Holliday junction resolvase